MESATETYRPHPAAQASGAGKGEMVRQELTSGREIGRLGKPHSEQGQIEGLKGRPSRPRVGRMTLVATSGLD